MSTDPARLPAFRLASEIRSGRIAATEALEAHLNRVGRHNPHVNAVVTLDVDRARQEAAAADQAHARGETRGPLHGVPMTIKDSFETAGIRTTSGSATLMDHVPAADAVAVQRLRRAGAIIYGKTNLPRWADDLQTFNQPFGTTVNPHGAERTPGGSSGGAAAALATYMTPLELGSDIGGSIRTPANWTGIFGHKPTHGLIPMRGHIPGPPGTLGEADLSVAGPMARTAADLTTAFRLLAGPDEWRAVGWRLQLPAPRAQSPSGLRVAVWLDDADFPVDTGVRSVLERAIGRLEEAGAAVVERQPVESMDHLVRTYMRLLFAVTLAGLDGDRLDRMVAEASGLDIDDLAGRPARFGAALHREWLRANESRWKYRAAFAGFFEEVDVLLTPITSTAAIPHDHTSPMWARTVEVDGVTRNYLELFAWIAPATCCLLPATAVPVGFTAGGLPVGIQVVGPYLSDHTTLRVAEMLEELIGGFVPPAMVDGS